jgi:hypothetical protein
VGQVFGIDWETALLSNVPEDDTALMYERAFADISSFVLACYHPTTHPYLPGIGLLDRVDEKTGLEIVQNTILAPYVEKRMTTQNLEKPTEDIVRLLTDVREIPNTL